MKAKATGLAVGLMATLVVIPQTAGAQVGSGHAAGDRHPPRCTIVGTPGPDRLVGTRQADVICGRGGQDTLIGRGGDDLLLGGPDRDVLVGDKGDDDLLGQRGPDEMFGGADRDDVIGGAGDDDLDGGPAADDLDGGPGTNYCTIDGDYVEDCVPDAEDPAADALTFSLDAVDVTDGNQQVTVRAHLTDDTGVFEVAVSPQADTPWFDGFGLHLASGTVRDGWWEGTMLFKQYSRPGTYRPSLGILDRTDRWVKIPFTQQSVTVLDDTPDVENPEVALLAPTIDQTYDVRTSPQSVTVQAHIADDLTGVDPDRVHFVIWAPRVGGHQTVGYGASMKRQSGDLHDGVWSGNVWIDAGSPSGRWNIGIYVSDQANPGRTARSIYWGPDEYPYQQFYSSEGDNRPLPGGMGVFTMLGD